jgi:hypothetical protein
VAEQSGIINGRFFLGGWIDPFERWETDGVFLQAAYSFGQLAGEGRLLLNLISTVYTHISAAQHGGSSGALGPLRGFEKICRFLPPFL